MTEGANSLEDVEAEVARYEVDRASDPFRPPLALLIVDYVQLMSGPSHIRERRLQVEAISGGLKEIARKHQVPVVAVSALNRPAKQPPGKKPDQPPRPNLEDLRESGRLEHDADTVLFLYRLPQAAETEVIVAKQRDGHVGIARLVFTAEYVSFSEPEAVEPRGRRDLD
jgi:replicative DNA helicase